MIWYDNTVKVLFIAAEVAPFVSVGGLSQVMYFLPQALQKIGHDVRIFTARYGTMDETLPKNKWKFVKEYNNLAVPYNGDLDKTIPCSISSITDAKNNISTYFLENREYYELRANVYGYRDDHTRFALLSKGALEWLYQMKNDQLSSWFPDIIHCHDWHTGYFIDMARHHPRYQHFLTHIPIVLTVHNFYLQGNYDFRYAPREEYDDGKIQLAPLNSPKLQTQNPLKRGLLYADAINTVSQTHAVEVLTPEYAAGLDDVLFETRGKLTGILNGLDTKRFNPRTDKLIKKQFDSDSFIRARDENKKDLQAYFNLPKDPQKPLLSFSGRLWQQKGIDLLLEVLPHLFEEKPEVQVVVLGSGDERYRLELSVLQKKFPTQLGLHLRPDFKLPRKIFSGADMMIIPSLFEPGGIVALEAMRYGCVPLVRRTGGLNDIVTDFNPASKKGNGFSFTTKESFAFFAAIIEGLTIYKYPTLWRKLVKNCMSCDFSWNHAAKEYDSWYRQIMSDSMPIVDEHVLYRPHGPSQVNKN